MKEQFISNLLERVKHRSFSESGVSYKILRDLDGAIKSFSHSIDQGIIPYDDIVDYIVGVVKRVGESGYNDGITARKSLEESRLEDAYNTGFKHGNKEGRKKGEFFCNAERSDAYELGYNDGINEDKALNQKALDDEFEKGCESGFDDGFSKGFEEGERKRESLQEEEYLEGHKAGVTWGYNKAKAELKGKTNISEINEEKSYGEQYAEMEGVLDEKYNK